MTKQKKLILLIIVLLGITVLNLLRSCGSDRPPELEELKRLAHCAACGKTVPLPSGYLGTLQPHQIQTNPAGQTIFACPECGVIAASPVMPGIPTAEAPAL